MASALVELSESFANAVERGGRSVVSVPEGGQSGVSGTVWRAGVVVAIAHTLRRREQISVLLPSGEKVAAQIAGADSASDLAVLKIESGPTEPVRLAEASSLKVGHIVLAIGRRPHGGLAASHGVISSIGGAFRTWAGAKMDVAIRLDLNPYPGFSGGPLVDTEGRAIGINTSGGRRGVMTIPTATVDRVVDQLLTKGRVARGYLGVAMQPASLAPGIAKALGLSRHALLVVQVADGSPAEKAGVLVGDVVLSLEGKDITDLREFQAALDPERIGQNVRVTVLRGGERKDLTITVGERSER